MTTEKINSLTIISAEFNGKFSPVFAGSKPLVTVTTANGVVKVVTAQYLNDCTGCDIETLQGAVGQIWD